MMKNNFNNKKNILEKLNILYIEDELEIRKNIKKTLNLICNEIYDTDSIEKAKEIIEKNKIDIIISDINLPKSSGIEFVKDVRLNNKDIPIILLSAYTEKKFLLEATKLKLIDYLVKPIDFKMLLNALEKSVEDIIRNSKYIINFNDEIEYNVLENKLSNLKTKAEILLTSKELLLLNILIDNSNRFISKEELKSELWEDSFEASESGLKNLLNKLRKKIGKSSIKNLSGIGYQIIIE